MITNSPFIFEIVQFFRFTMEVMDVESQPESDLMIKQGAEGRVYKTKFLGRVAILKERFVKTYRHPELDARLTKERIRAEAKSIVRCKNAGKYFHFTLLIPNHHSHILFSGICTPAVYSVDFSTNKITMEYIDHSETVSEYIYKLSDSRNDKHDEELKNVSAEMGRVIGKMHHNNIIHGDLTTSNILVQHLDNSWKLFLIDFGLSYIKSSDEDKAVDLYVLERALLSKHSNVSWFFDNFLKHYAGFDKSTDRVVKKLSEVRSRGRKRTMIG